MVYRTGSDKRVGSFTCYTPRGCSVVDYSYFVVSQNFVEFISDMSVHNVTEHSGHCPILLDISIPQKMTMQSKIIPITQEWKAKIGMLIVDIYS